MRPSHGVPTLSYWSLSKPWIADVFQDRREAGRTLARHLAEYADRPGVIVLALPRGGVPVAYEVAKALHVPMDVLLVRKLGVPGHEEYAMGAVASVVAHFDRSRAVEPLERTAEWERGELPETYPVGV